MESQHISDTVALNYLFPTSLTFCLLMLYFPVIFLKFFQRPVCYNTPVHIQLIFVNEGKCRLKCKQVEYYYISMNLKEVHCI